MNLEARELAKARAWRMNAPELAIEFVALAQAFFGTSTTKQEITDLLIHRGLSVAEASAVAKRYETLTGEISE